MTSSVPACRRVFDGLVPLVRVSVLVTSAPVLHFLSTPRPAGRGDGQLCAGEPLLPRIETEGTYNPQAGWAELR